MNPICPYCEKESMLVRGDIIYPKLKYLHKKAFFLCEPCNAYVGCHKGSTNPLGRLANAKLRAKKVRAHDAFDPIWNEHRYFERSDAYTWLAQQMGMKKKDCHIGRFTEEQCDLVHDICARFIKSKEVVVIRRSPDGAIQRTATVAVLEIG